MRDRTLKLLRVPGQGTATLIRLRPLLGLGSQISGLYKEGELDIVRADLNMLIHS